MTINDPFKPSPIFLWNYNCKKQIVVNQGGTSSGKTYSILQMLLLKAAETKNIRVTVAGQDMPNLKVGAIRDFQTILNSNDLFSLFIKKVNMSDKTWHLNNGSIIEFKSYDNEQDARNGKRDYLFVNEANGIHYEIFYQLNFSTFLGT
jgi:phage terminase large subunit